MTTAQPTALRTYAIDRAHWITINRKDFGLLWNAALETGGFLVGDEVRVTVAVQAAEAQ